MKPETPSGWKATPTMLLIEAIEAAGKQFRFYEKQHLAKNPPDEAKAKVNAEWAENCENVLKGYLEAINRL